MQRHMGVVPMSKRRDPVAGMAEAVRRMQRKCDAIANETEDYVMCGTPFINVFPNNAVNIPQQVRSPVPCPIRRGRVALPNSNKFKNNRGDLRISLLLFRLATHAKQTGNTRQTQRQSRQIHAK